MQGARPVDKVTHAGRYFGETMASSAFKLTFEYQNIDEVTSHVITLTDTWQDEGNRPEPECIASFFARMICAHNATGNGMGVKSIDDIVHAFAEWFKC